MSCFRYGFQTKLQYSNCDLASDLYSLSIVSSSLVTIVFLIKPKVELAFSDASAHCLDGFALLCIITPKSLSSSRTFNILPPLGFAFPPILLLVLCDREM